MKNYIATDDIYTDPVRGRDFDFTYSEGDEAENYLLQLISGATDLSIGSQELTNGIRDWSSKYHLNPKRADLIRPFQTLLKGKSILEIGSGCGAITRYLAESGGQVTALEGSYRRAKITMQRCRDLSAVKVICDNFEDFYVPEKFDIITLIGVLEYSNLFIHAENAVEAILQKVRAFLKPGGSVIIAIENKLGLKYLAGAPEDHTDKPYFGIENKYDRSTAVTFGKAELNRLLGEAGFGQSSFLYPFPDYKLPKIILTEDGILDKSFHPEELLSEKLEYFQTHAYTSFFSTSLAMEAFAKNDLLSAFSNSFLILASLEETEKKTPHDILAYVYSTNRTKAFCKENIFVRNDAHQINVIRHKIYNLTTDAAHVLYQKLENEPYFAGHVFAGKMINITSRSGWTVEELGDWAQAYYTILCKYAVIKDNGVCLEGKYVDLIPANIILREGLEIQAFDQEWIIREDLPVYYVFFRGIRYSLGDILFFDAPAEGTPLNTLDLSLAVINKVFPFTSDMLEDCLEREIRYFSPVVNNGIPTFGGGTIFIRGTYQMDKQRTALENELRAHLQELTASKKELGYSMNTLMDLKNRHVSLQTELSVLKNELQFMRSILSETRQKAETEKYRTRQLEREKGWYIQTYDKKSIFSIAKYRLLHFFNRKLSH